MANVIALFKTYIDLLDEVYKQSSKTKDLDINGALVQAGANANEIVVPKLSMDGLGEYSRNGGYTDGDVKLSNETVQFNYDRGRRFAVDAMDNAESAGVAFGQLSAEFIRTQVVPEMDAMRFAKYASTEGISKVAAGANLTTGEEVLAALVAAKNKMDEDEVPEENRILYITPTCYNLVYAVDTTKSKEVLNSFSKIIKVPQSRFYTAINLLDGKSEGEEKGGYEKAEGAKDINFMIIHIKAPLQYPKHTVNKVVPPEDNQTSDGYLFFYRAYGLADVYENKVAGIYLHHKA